MIEYTIKKYPNRRLYDTVQSKYITLTNVKDLIISGVSIKVIDSTNEEDLTRSILMQIIIESEASGEPIFSSSLLQQIIRFYGSSFQTMFTKYMEESMQLFINQQTEVPDSLLSDPLTAMTKMTEKNVQVWQDMQKNFFDNFSTSATKSNTNSTKKPSE